MKEGLRRKRREMGSEENEEGEEDNATYTPAHLNKNIHPHTHIGTTYTFMCTQTHTHTHTFVQLGEDVGGQVRGGLHVGGVDVECLGVSASSLPLLHGLPAHAEDAPPKVLHLRVLHQLKLTDGHAYGKACAKRYVNKYTRKDV